MKFDDLLKGRKLHELTDDEIDEITKQCSREELAKVETTVRKATRQTKSVKSLESERKKREEFNRLLLGGK